LPIEAYPDVADTWVQVITQWPRHAAEETERQVSLPVELEMAGVPHMTHLRSTSIFDLSVVTLIFEDGTDGYFARQQLVERLQNAELPEDVQPNLGPLASHDITLSEGTEALAHSNRSAGGGFIQVGPQSVNVRGVGLIRSPEELLNISIKTSTNGTPILLRDAADVEIGHAPRRSTRGCVLPTRRPR
jgi:Cu/Ag efflux pump CusA